MLIKKSLTAVTKFLNLFFQYLSCSICEVLAFSSKASKTCFDILHNLLFHSCFLLSNFIATYFRKMRHFHIFLNTQPTTHIRTLFTWFLHETTSCTPILSRCLCSSSTCKDLAQSHLGPQSVHTLNL